MLKPIKSLFLQSYPTHSLKKLKQELVVDYFRAPPLLEDYWYRKQLTVTQLFLVSYLKKAVQDA